MGDFLFIFSVMVCRVAKISTYNTSGVRDELRKKRIMFLRYSDDEMKSIDVDFVNFYM